MPESPDVDTKSVGKAFCVEINGQFIPVKSYSGGDIIEPDSGPSISFGTSLGLGGSSQQSESGGSTSPSTGGSGSSSGGGGGTSGGIGITFPFRGASQHNESTMGHNYITELTLVSYITPDNMALSDAANAVANQGKNERYTITITEMAKDKSVVKTFVYDNCLLTGMDFPAVDAGSGEILCRTTTWKPEILTVS